jgi:hypothetical protein
MDAAKRELRTDERLHRRGEMSYASGRLAPEGQPCFSIDDRELLDRSRLVSRYSG